MAIKYSKNEGRFLLSTKDTLYAITLLHGRYLVHTYYGKKRPAPELKFEPSVVSFSPYKAQYGNEYSPDVFLQECPTYGSGDFRPTALRIKNGDGNSVTEFAYKSHRKYKGRHEIQGLPHARAAEDTETLEIKLTDDVAGTELKLFYTVYFEENVITRSMQVTNKSKKDIKIENCMPLCLDLEGYEYDLIKLWGGHCYERNFERTPLSHGTQVISSSRGASSHQFNPFMALCDKKAGNDKGDVYGFNFVFSGSFENSVHVDQLENTRVLVGLGSECFAYTLTPGESFDSPEAVMTYSPDGLNGMSGNFHKFINKYIVPEGVLEGHRPVVLNTWEACYFNIDEEKLVAFAKEAAKTGFDMLVMDDGWFGKRNNDKAGLGDWTPNPAKFKNGLGSFISRVKAEGVQFGIWIEPEMVNPDSDLYRSHPEWCLACPRREKSLSRDQWVLDMSNPEVVEYLKGAFTKVFEGLEIDYIKWDMNRHLSEVGSAYHSADRQDEVMYRYVLGVYELCRFFREKFPKTMIEHCSGGGGRYDLGIMQYCSQIWTSDNTWPYARTPIQYSSLLGYPASVMSCHVSNPGDNMKSLDYRFKVAVGGVLGYELNILTVSDEAKRIMSEQVKLYKTFDRLILTGEYYTVIAPVDSRFESHYFINEDRSEILLSYVERRNSSAGKILKLRVRNADKKAVYEDKITGDTYTGKELFDGVEVISEGVNDYARLWHFVKKI